MQPVLDVRSAIFSKGSLKFEYPDPLLDVSGDGGGTGVVIFPVSLMCQPSFKGL